MTNHVKNLVPLLLGVLAGVGVTQLRAGRDYEVAKPSENIRAAPEGRHIGTLLEGATIEEVGRDGRWVKFQLEAWIWGPSLEGYQSEPSIAPMDDAEKTTPVLRTKQRLPRIALSSHLDEVRELIDAEFGRFYGMSRDPDLNQVQIRFRVREIEPEALERRQMRVQHAVLMLLADDVEFESLRIVTNRPDGSGEVGAEMVVTEVDDIRRVDGQNLALWRQLTRRSTDGGKTWAGLE
ncbi:MAG: hypothetical protein VYD18_15025 [Candidatus Latescibacterota bacterium]|nr:hypothetical protein [Candidatus Latescibacterota bacterium]